MTIFKAFFHTDIQIFLCALTKFSSHLHRNYGLYGSYGNFCYKLSLKRTTTSSTLLHQNLITQLMARDFDNAN